METVDTLFIKFGCKDDQALAALFNKANKSVVSHWRKKGLPAAVERKALELMKARGMVAEPITPYENTEEGRTTDEVEKMILRKMRKRGKAYQFRWLATVEAEEEAELKNNPAS